MIAWRVLDASRSRSSNTIRIRSAVGIELCTILNRHSIHAYPLLLTEYAAQVAEEKRQYEATLAARKKITGTVQPNSQNNLAGLHGEILVL